MAQHLLSFKAVIQIIGINPYVLLPEKVLNNLFLQAEKSKGPIPVKGNINGADFVQTLVKYAGQWRLYLNTPMRTATKTEVGDRVTIGIAYDIAERIIPMHLKLKTALQRHKEAKKVFDALPPSRKKEIVRYIAQLKTEEAIDRNVFKTIQFLLGKQRHIGRDHP